MPPYYLDFGSNVVKRISYAASLSTNSICDGYEVFVMEKLKRFNAISVREKTGAILLEKLGFSNISVVLDPVFLLDEVRWKILAQKGNMYGLKDNSYIVVYDFLGNDENMVRFVKEYAKKYSLKIVSINDFTLREYADKNINDAGPLEFLALISKAACVVANSFHATAFSLIFGKEFYTFNLHGYNNSSRMKDLLFMIGLCERLNPLKESGLIDYREIKRLLECERLKSKEYIYNSLKK